MTVSKAPYGYVSKKDDKRKATRNELIAIRNREIQEEINREMRDHKRAPGVEIVNGTVMNISENKANYVVDRIIEEAKSRTNEKKLKDISLIRLNEKVDMILNDLAPEIPRGRIMAMLGKRQNHEIYGRY